MLSPPFVLILSGPAGAGKSTVGALVARTAEPAVCLESDWLYTTIAAGFVAPWEPHANEQNRTVLRAAFAAVARFADGGYGVVVEGVVGPWHLDVVAAELRTLDVPVSYVVLRPDLATCLGRATGRAGEVPRVAGNPPLTDEGPLRALWQRFADLGPYERHVLDPSALDAVATASLVGEAVASGSHRLSVG